VGINEITIEKYFNIHIEKKDHNLKNQCLNSLDNHFLCILENKSFIRKILLDS
jgi:hypothetical protein